MNLFESAYTAVIERYEGGWDFLSREQRFNAIAAKIMQYLDDDRLEGSEFKAAFTNAYAELLNAPL